MAGSLAIPNVIGNLSGPTVAASLLDTNWTTIRDYVNNREIAAGGLAARPAAAIAGRYYFSTDNNGQILWLDSGSAWTPLGVGIVARSLTVVDDVASVATTQLAGWTVPGGTLGTTRAFVIDVIGDFLNNTGVNQNSPVLTVIYGGTTIVTDNSATSLAANATRYLWQLHAVVSAQGATNAQVASGWLAWIAPATLGVLSPTTFVHYAVNTGLAVDSTAGQVLAIQATNAVNNANYSTRHQATQVALV